MRYDYDILKNFKKSFLRLKDSAASFFDLASNSAKINYYEHNSLKNEFESLKKIDDEIIENRKRLLKKVRIINYTIFSLLVFLVSVFGYLIFVFSKNKILFILGVTIFLLTLLVYFIYRSILYFKEISKRVLLAQNKVDENVIVYKNKILLKDLIYLLNDSSAKHLINKANENITLNFDDELDNDLSLANDNLKYINLTEGASLKTGIIYKRSFIFSKEEYDASYVKSKYKEKIIKNKIKLIVPFDHLNNLTFERVRSNNLFLPLKEQAILHNLEAKELDRMQTETKDITFTKLEDELFETMFESYNRSNEISYRMMFTPVARNNYINILKNNNLGYGDIYDIKKLDKYFLTDVYFPQDESIDYMFYFDNMVDIKKIRAEFIKSQLRYFRVIFFIFAPILSIPEFIIKGGTYNE